MPTPTGAITFQDVQDEFGGSHPITMSEMNAFIGQAATATISMSQLQGLSASLDLTYLWTAEIGNFTTASLTYSALSGYGSALAAGDIVIYIGLHTNLSSIATPTGFNNIDNGLAYTRGSGTINYGYGIAWKLLTAADTVLAGTSGGGSGTAGTAIIHAYRPSGTPAVINTGHTTNTSTSGATGSNASASNIKFAATFHENNNTMTWSGADATEAAGISFIGRTMTSAVEKDDDGSYSNSSWSVGTSYKSVFGYINVYATW